MDKWTERARPPGARCPAAIAAWSPSIRSATHPISWPPTWTHPTPATGPTFFTSVPRPCPCSRVLTGLARSDDPLHYTIVDTEAAKPVGTAALMRIDSVHGVIEVGSIAYSPRIRRTRAGTEAMYLLMRLVFEDLGYRRYEWKCDSLNGPSRVAALRYGFTFEGIFRRAIVYKGRNRDTAWYSIIAEEWPRIRSAFDAWLDPKNFDARGRQRHDLKAMRPPL